MKKLLKFIYNNCNETLILNLIFSPTTRIDDLKINMNVMYSPAEPYFRFVTYLKRGYEEGLIDQALILHRLEIITKVTKFPCNLKSIYNIFIDLLFTNTTRESSQRI